MGFLFLFQILAFPVPNPSSSVAPARRISHPWKANRDVCYRPLTPMRRWRYPCDPSSCVMLGICREFIPDGDVNDIGVSHRDGDSGSEGEADSRGMVDPGDDEGSDVG